MSPPVSSTVSGEIKPVLSNPDQNVNALYQVPGTVPTGLTPENDEGRDRTHPLYSEGPKPDGMYHCPFVAKEANCPHKPTKLKCNYEYELPSLPDMSAHRLLTTPCPRSKFIDSHLKPFRCKFESCAKQEFSSTACRLRHEREAHGMHGHGDKPHICIYTGCDRGIPGNGFPRRYNLFDHMRRVHGHEYGSGSSTANPVVDDDSQGPKKIAGRKRKASASPTVEPATERPEAMRLRPQQSQATQGMYLQGPVYFQQPVYAPGQPRGVQHQQRLYTQWANQRDLLAKQANFVASPEDDVSLERLSQNIEEFRRLSAEARRR